MRPNNPTVKRLRLLFFRTRPWTGTVLLYLLLAAVREAPPVAARGIAALPRVFDASNDGT